MRASAWLPAEAATMRAPGDPTAASAARARSKSSPVGAATGRSAASGYSPRWYLNDSLTLAR
jgi:hypothetical protein